MLVSTTIASLICLFAPQDSAATQATATVPRLLHAGLLPQQTLAAVSWLPWSAHAQELAATGLVSTLAKVPLPAPIQTLAAKSLRRIEQVTGLSAATLGAMLQQGGTIAWTGLDPRGAPQLVFGIEAGAHQAEYGSALESLRGALQKSGWTVQQELVEKIEVVALRHPRLQAWSYALTPRVFICGTVHKQVTEAVSRAVQGGPSLSDAKNYRTWCTHLANEPAGVAVAYADPAEITTALLASAPLRTRQNVTQTLATLHLTTLGGIGLSIAARDGQLHETLRICLPEPREGLLPSLLGEGGVLKPGVAALVPPDVAGFSLGNLDLRQAAQEVQALLTHLLPDAAKSLAADLQELRERESIDVERDILGNLGGTTVSLRWQHEDATGFDTAWMIEVQSAARVRESLAVLLRKLEVHVKSTQVGEHRIETFTTALLPPGVEPCYVVGEGYLVVAGTARAMQAALAQLGSLQPHQHALDGLQRAGKGTTWYSRMQLTALAPLVAATLGVNPRGMDLRGDMESMLAFDPHGLVVHTRSSVGNVVTLLGAAYGLCAMLPQDWDQQVTTLLSLSSGEDADVLPRLIQKLGEAERRFHADRKRDEDGDGTGEYVNLSELANSGYVDATELGALVAEGTFERDGYLLRVMMPPTLDGREQCFVVLAWPARQATGMVYAATEQKTLLSNQILANTMGLAEVDARDVYAKGSFGGTLATGWKDMTFVAPEQRRAVEREDQERRYRALLQAAETMKPGAAAPEVAECLNSNRPELAARAAWIVGHLRIVEGVPKLCDLATAADDAEVRHQAMAALHALADPRSRQASLQALASTDPRVRALAAANLGRLRSRDTGDSLVGMLAATKGEAGNDRVQALTTLADFGDPSCLLPAAAVITPVEDKNGREIEHALAFLFQTLSPKLGHTEEVKVLLAALDHPSAQLRRYVIQRLGELKDSDTLSALEARLAKEDQALAPLVEVALTAVRGTQHGAEEGAHGGAPKFYEPWLRKWQAMPAQQQLVVAGAAAAFLIALTLLVVVRRRLARVREAEEWAARVAPSDEYLANQDAPSDTEPAEEPYEEVGAGPTPPRGQHR